MSTPVTLIAALFLSASALAHDCVPLKAPKSPAMATFAADMAAKVSASKKLGRAVMAIGAYQVAKVDPPRREYTYSFATDTYANQGYKEEVAHLFTRIIRGCLLRSFPFLGEEAEGFNLHPVRAAVPKYGTAEEKRQRAYDQIAEELDHDSFNAIRAAAAVEGGLALYVGYASAKKGGFQVLAVADQKSGQIVYFLEGDLGHYLPAAAK